MRASHAACSAALSGALALAMIGTAASVRHAATPAAPAALVVAVFEARTVPTTPVAPPAAAAAPTPTRVAVARR